MAEPTLSAEPGGVPARLLLVDDHPLFHEGLAAALQRDRPAWRLDGAGSLAQARQALLVGPEPDLLLIDLRLPDGDGLQPLAALSQAAPLVPRVVISGRLDAARVRQARVAGASACLSKGWPVERIIQALQQVLDGGTDFSLLDDWRSSAAPVLTSRQQHVLDMLARGCSNRQIADSLDIAERTVRAHLTELFQALGAASRLQALLHAQQLGLIDGIDPPAMPAPGP